MTNFPLRGALDAPPSGTTRVQDVLEEWEIHAREWLQRHPQTVSHSRAAVLELAASASVEDLRSLTPRHVMAWLQAQPSTKTAWNKLASARAVFRWARRWRDLPSDPLEFVDLPKAPLRRGADSITPQEFRQLLDAALRYSDDPRSTGPARVRFYLFLWFTALRFSEARLQLWEDIDWRAGTMLVSRDKCRRGDSIPLARELLEEMRHWPRTNGLIFPQVPCHHILKADFAAAGIEGRGNWHRFRKGRVSQLVEGGVRLPLVAKLTRHQDLRTLLLRYTHIELAQVMDRPRFRLAE